MSGLIGFLLIAALLWVAMYRKNNNSGADLSSVAKSNPESDSLSGNDLITEVNKANVDALYLDVLTKGISIHPRESGARHEGCGSIYAVLAENRIDSSGLIRSIKQLLTNPLESEDDGFVEAALYFLDFFEEPSEHLDILLSLVVNIHHTSHEDIVGTLQHLGDEKSIPFLKEAIDIKPELKHLEYDDYGAYYKKCLWALTAIGSDEAKYVISGFASSAIPELKKEAIYRLSKFDSCSEFSRKQRQDAGRS